MANTAPDTHPSSARQQRSSEPARVLYEPARSSHAGDSFLARYTELLGESQLERLAKRQEEILIRVDSGEVGAFRGLRPAFVRAVVEQVRELDRHPVLFDTCHLRQTAKGLGWSSVDAATINGLVSSALGTEINVGDGWGGGETELLAVEGEELGGIEVARVVVRTSAAGIRGRVERRHRSLGHGRTFAQSRRQWRPRVQIPPWMTIR